MRQLLRIVWFGLATLQLACGSAGQGPSEPHESIDELASPDESSGGAASCAGGCDDSAGAADVGYPSTESICAEGGTLETVDVDPAPQNCINHECGDICDPCDGLPMNCEATAPFYRCSRRGLCGGTSD